MTAEPALEPAIGEKPGGRRGLLSERVAQMIERYIVDGALNPGDRLPSGRELTERYGVSRTVVRDAIAVLEQRGLVESWPGSGVFVCDGGSEAVAGVLGQMLRRNAISLPELLETRQLLEIHNAELAATRGAADQIAEMERAVGRMRDAAEPMRFVEADVAFHEALAEAAGNRVLSAFLRSLRPMLLQGMLIGTGIPGAREAALREHTALQEAVRAGNVACARAVMEAHLRRGYNELVQAGYANLKMRRNPSPGALD